MATTITTDLMAKLRYYSSEHPTVTRFRWEEQLTPGAAVSFLALALLIYFTSILILKLLLSIRKSGIPLGPLPLLHNFILLGASVTIFAGCLQATLVEHEQSRWLWESSGRSWSWLLCFPPETRPAGRVFFWSYVYYMSKYYELVDTLVVVLRKRRLTLFHVLQHAGNLVVCFCWLHFVQSLQVVFLLVNTLIQTFVYAYFFFASLGFDPPVKELVTLLQIFQFVVSLGASGWLAVMIRDGEKCSGSQSCAGNAVFNLVLVILLTNYYIQVFLRKKPTGNKRTRRKKAE